MQALSQLSYGPEPCATRLGFASSSRRLLAFTASKIKPLVRLFSNLVFVVVVADADDAGNVVFVFLVIGKEGVVIVVAEVDVIIVIVER